MPQDIRVGTVLMSDWPPLFGLESEPYYRHWSVATALDGFAIDRKIRAAGWNFFFIAAEVRVMFFGAVGAKKVQHAVRRILAKVGQRHFNGIEVTGIVPQRFLGLPYTIVSAHSRHLQQNCCLDNTEARRGSQRLAQINGSRATVTALQSPMGSEWNRP